MKAHTRRIIATIVVLTAALAGTSAVVAASAATDQQHRVLFRYSGRLIADPASDATEISVAVETGNKRALRSLLGHSADQNFGVGDRTEYLRWTAGIPHVVAIDDLAPNDWVTVNVRAAARSDLGEIEATQAGIVGDRGQNPDFTHLPLFQFDGQVSAAAAGGKLSVHVAGGNRNALRKLLGHSADQTFTYGDETIFIRWQGKVPTVISADQLRVGDRVAVKIRASLTTTLDQLEQMPVNRVAEHERAAHA